MTRKEWMFSRIIALISSVILSWCCCCFFEKLGINVIMYSMVFFAAFILAYDSLINAIKNRNRRGSFADFFWCIDTVVLFVSVLMAFSDFNGISREIIFYIFTISFTCFIFYPCVCSCLGSSLFKK